MPLSIFINLKAPIVTENEGHPSVLIVFMIAGCFALAQIMAIFAGLGWIGVPWWGALMLMPLLFLLREIGAFPASILGFVGATNGWGWDW